MEKEICVLLAVIIACTAYVLKHPGISVILLSTTAFALLTTQANNKRCKGASAKGASVQNPHYKGHGAAPVADKHNQHKKSAATEDPTFPPDSCSGRVEHTGGGKYCRQTPRVQRNAEHLSKIS